jgi:hypothetical protein
MEAVSSSKTPVHFYQTTWRHISQAITLSVKTRSHLLKSPEFIAKVIDTYIHMPFTLQRHRQDTWEGKKIDFQGTTRRYVPEDRTLHNHRCENLKSYKYIRYRQKDVKKQADRQTDTQTNI